MKTYNNTVWTNKMEYIISIKQGSEGEEVCMNYGLLDTVFNQEIEWRKVRRGWVFKP